MTMHVHGYCGQTSVERSSADLDLAMNTFSYFLLKASNTAIQLAFGILTTFVFLRVLSIHIFASYILISAIGTYTALADLGCSSLIYVNLRKTYLSGRDVKTPLEEALAALLTYAAVVLLVLLVVSALVVSDVVENHGTPLNLILYLLFWLLLLPWNIVRTSASAVDLYVPSEAVELMRRLLVTGFLIALLAGLGIRPYLIAINIVWAGCFLIAAFFGRRLFEKY